MTTQSSTAPAAQRHPSRSGSPPRPLQPSPKETTTGAITTWQLSQSGFGGIGVFHYEFGYAGGFAIAGFGDATPLTITNLGGGNIALSVTLTWPNGGEYAQYLNSHYPFSDFWNNAGMVLWYSGDDFTYSSDSIGSEQTFRLVNLGGGNIALQATGGQFPGQYLTGMQGGWYPSQWSMGTGSFLSTGSPAALQVGGPLLPILVIANSGYELDLSGQTLPSIDLADADMRRCNLDRADLSGVTGLQGANFTGAVLRGANLTGKSLTGADWTGADFTSNILSGISTAAGANLTGAILANTTLTGVNFSGATLTGASLAGAVLDNADLSGANLSGANLSGATIGTCNLTGAELANVTLCGQDLRQAILVRANLSGTSLSGCNLAGVDLTGACLLNTNFTDCTVSGMKLGGNKLAGANFTGLDLSTVRFSPPLGQSTNPDAPTVLAGATLPYAAIGLNWSCLDLTGATVTGLPASLAGLNAMGARLAGHSFEGCTLDGANFAQATLDSVDFTDASLRDKPVFDGAVMPGAVFTRAKLDEASFVGAALGGVTQIKAAGFSFAYVANCDFSQANLFSVSFAGASLVGGNKLSGSANLQETDFSNAYMANADLTGAVLLGAKFDGAFMVECVLTDANLSPAQDGSAPASLTSACLQAATFQGTNFSGADLTNAAITDAAGQILMQYYDETGKLTPSFPLPYPAGSFPAVSSFDASTTCPNGAPYSANVSNGLSLAQMMAAPNPPTSWSPRDQARPPKEHALISAR